MRPVVLRHDQRPISRRAALAASLTTGLGAGLGAGPVAAGEADDLGARAEALVQDALTRSGAPGAAFAMVKDGRVLSARGFGVKKLGEQGVVGPRTLFGVASCSKAMTVAALGAQVAAGRLSWDDPVRTHLPDFEMSDPAVTRDIRVRDLLLHWSGLSLGAGDLMTWPRTTHSRAEIVRGVRHLPLVRPFRADYAYDNVLYVVAGEVAAAIDGKPFEAVVRDLLFTPLDMADAEVLPSRTEGRDRAWNHARVSQAVRGQGPIVPLSAARDDADNAIAAGGVACSARDLGQWLLAQLGRGRTPGGARAWSEAVADEMWRPRVIQRVENGPTPDRPDRPTFITYALGWEVRDFRGRRLVWHGGYAQGGLSIVVLLPSLNAGFALSVNAEEAALISAVRNGVLDMLMGHADRDWTTWALSRAQPPADEPPPEPVAPAGQPSAPLAAYAGTWRDPWYGDIVIGRRGGRLTIDFTKTIGMKGPLEPWGVDAFRTRWPDRNLEDALLSFTVENRRPTGLSLRRFNPDGDFSYDYQDLRPVRVED